MVVVLVALLRKTQMTKADLDKRLEDLEYNLRILAEKLPVGDSTEKLAIKAYNHVAFTREGLRRYFDRLGTLEQRLNDLSQRLENVEGHTIRSVEELHS
jgi:hypothetical protein